MIRASKLAPDCLGQTKERLKRVVTKEFLPRGVFTEEFLLRGFC